MIRVMERTAAKTMMRRGFTLVEAVATLMVIGVLSAVSSGLVLNATDQYMSAASRATLISEMSSGLERMTAELRSIPIQADSVPAAPNVLSLSADSISWHDGASVRGIGRQGSEVIISSGGGGAPLLRDVTSFSIRGIDKNNTLLPAVLNGPDCLQIQRVEIALTCSRRGEEETLRTLVFLRAAMAGGKS